MEYYVAMRKNKLQPHTTIRRNPTDIILSKRSLTPKGTYFMKPLVQIIQIGKASLCYAKTNEELLSERSDWKGVQGDLRVLVTLFPHNSYRLKMGFLGTLTFCLMHVYVV